MSLTIQEQEAKDKALAYFRQSPGAAASIGGAPTGGIPSAPTKNIIGIGIGTKIASGRLITGEVAVRIYVRAKIPRTKLPTGHTVPDNFNNLPTDVVEVGDVVAYQPLQTWQWFSYNRPTSCGVSIGHPMVTAGTLGCLVQ